MADGAIEIGTYDSYPPTQHGELIIGFYGANPPTIDGALIIGRLNTFTPHLMIY